ncbi:MAG TPA: hypothetical protein VI172_04015 [Candidatus Dormibacteraeota bacterium]|jgi:hypothetical protein
MRVKLQPASYTHTENGKTRHARAFALVSEDGKPTLVGLFASEDKAEAFCKARGWRLVKEPT